MASIEVKIQEVLREAGYRDAVKLSYDSGMSYGTAYTMLKSGNKSKRIDLETLTALCKVCNKQVEDFLVFKGNNNK